MIESVISNQNVNDINSENSTFTHKNDFWNPPGGFLIWLIILFEFFFFAISYTTIAHLRHSQQELFKISHTQLDLKFGIFLTLCLLFSGWQIAEFVHHFSEKKFKLARLNFFLAFVTGLIFVISKAFDYSAKIEKGFTLGTNDFWDLYWLLTLFHFIHVIIGLLILAVVYRKYSQNTLEDPSVSFRASAHFWHMCDVIWLFIFPLFYIGN